MSKEADSSKRQGPGDSPYWILGALAFGVFIAADDLTVVSTMLPRMIVDFEIPIPSGLRDAAWIVSAYLIAYVTAMPLMGRLSDRYGRLPLYALSLSLFLAGSLLVLSARTLPMLIAARALQAFGGGAVVPIAMAAVGDRFPEGRRGFAIGLLAAIDTLGWIWGPLYGALLIRYGPEVGAWLHHTLGLPVALAGWSWQWQFALNVPLTLLALAAAGVGRWAFGTPPRALAVDIPGVALFSAALIALHFGLARMGGSLDLPDFSNRAPGAPEQAWPWLLLSALALLLLLGYEHRAHAPFLPLELFRRRNLVGAGLVNLILGIGLITPMVQVPLFINTLRGEGATPEEWLGRAALRSGQVLSGLTGGMALGALIGGWASRWGYRRPALIGILAAALALGLAARWEAEEPFGRMFRHMALAGLGLGAATSAVSAAALDAAPPTARGLVSGLLLILRLIGMSLGMAGLTAWGTSRFERMVAAYTLAELPAALPAITLAILREIFGLAALTMGLALPIAATLRPLREGTSARSTRSSQDSVIPDSFNS